MLTWVSSAKMKAENCCWIWPGEVAGDLDKTRFRRVVDEHLVGVGWRGGQEVDQVRMEI